MYCGLSFVVVLYGYETCSCTSREERRLKVFENRVLRKISGSKVDEVIGEWRRLHNEELYVVLITRYYSGDKIRKNVIGGSCSTCRGHERFHIGSW